MKSELLGHIVANELDYINGKQKNFLDAVVEMSDKPLPLEVL